MFDLSEDPVLKSVLTIITVLTTTVATHGAAKSLPIDVPNVPVSTIVALAFAVISSLANVFARKSRKISSLHGLTSLGHLLAK